MSVSLENHTGETWSESWPDACVLDTLCAHLGLFNASPGDQVVLPWDGEILPEDVAHLAADVLDEAISNGTVKMQHHDKDPMGRTLVGGWDTPWVDGKDGPLDDGWKDRLERFITFLKA